jgi:hypothetical protein
VPEHEDTAAEHEEDVTELEDPFFVFLPECPAAAAVVTLAQRVSALNLCTVALGLAPNTDALLCRKLCL